MKTPRGPLSSARIMTVAGATAALALAAPLGSVAVAGESAAAQQELPTYRCEITSAELPEVTGEGVCEALNGAPEQGPVGGPFLITSWRAMPFQCESGQADLPTSVVGQGCVAADQAG